jgi:glycosyltransferase involved in cell wall biosynthesis
VARVTLVSVVIPTRGGRTRLPQLFEDLTQQTHSCYEVIVVVDGDIDDTAGLCAERRHQLPLNVITFPHNQGRAAALNAGFAAAKGAILIRCDDDLGLLPTHLAGHVRHHQGRTAIGVVGMCRNIYAHSRYAEVYGRPRDLSLRTDAYLATPAERWRYWGANVSVDADTYALVGPYDESFCGYGWEDVDWGWRLHQTGVPIVITPDLEVTHQVAATSTIARAKRAFASGAAQRQFENKHNLTKQHQANSRGLWGRSIAGFSRRLNDQSLVRWAKRADYLAGYAPDPAAEKMISAVVEASALAGYQKAMVNDG